MWVITQLITNYSTMRLKKDKIKKYKHLSASRSRAFGMPWLPGVAMIPVLFIIMLSCDISDFGEMNVNPTQVTQDRIQDTFIFPMVQVSIAGNREEHWRANLIYSSSIVQHVAHPWYAGESYAQNIPWAVWFWESAYSGGGVDWRAQVKNVEDLLHLLQTRQEEGEAVSNKLAMTRILRTFIYHRITDLYGDAPYSEAGKGDIDKIFAPKFDSQEFIYNDMLNELAEAVQQFDASEPGFGSADLWFGGNIPQWQRFANSLRLRLALRLVKRDLNKAQTEAEAAVNAPAGLITSMDDIVYHRHEVGPGATCCNPHGNPIAFVYDADPDIYLSQTMVNWMLDNNDPRLRVYGAVYQGDEVITDPALQMGRPNGYTNFSWLQSHPSWEIAVARGSGDPEDGTNQAGYTKLHRRWLDVTNPQVFLTHAEVEFMLAEMAVRGWDAPSDAAAHYNNGVRAAMEYLSLYVGDTDISAAEIDDYLADNPFNEIGTQAQQLRQINTQYWAAVFLNGYEAWANWRRTGYPVLEAAPVDADITEATRPHPSSDTGGEFPRRLVYSNSDVVLNSANYQEAINRQGPDNLTTRIWWDRDN
jgi:hypothetical protein